jgi:hypothetical protein
MEMVLKEVTGEETTDYFLVCGNTLVLNNSLKKMPSQRMLA